MMQKIRQKLLAFFRRLFDRKEDVHIEQKIIASDNGEIHISIHVGKQ